MDRTKLVADGLVLRAYRPDDEAGLRAHFSDADTLVWNAGPADGDLTGWWQFRNNWTAGDHASWAVAAADDDRLVGSLSVFDIDREHGDAEIGYGVVPPARGRGVARRAVTIATRWAFTELGLHRVHLYHSVGNVASCHVAAAAGFLLEGTLRESYRYGDGVRHDEHLHARLASDRPTPDYSPVAPSIVSRSRSA